MSRSLATNWRSRDSLNWRTRCGWSPWVCQIRCTELTLIPTCLAIIGAVQWVTSPGGSVCVSATVRSCTVAGSRGIRDGRVLSRSSPSTPSTMQRSCQRQTVTLLLPVRRMIVVVPMPSAVISTMRARHTCFCGRFRSAMIAVKRSRSPSPTWTVIPWRMLSPHHPSQPSVHCADSFVRFYPLVPPLFLLYNRVRITILTAMKRTPMGVRKELPIMSQQLFAFVVMPFAKEFEDKYVLGIKSAAEDAGMRVERLKDQIFYRQGMVERIHHQIEEADFIIGDMTEPNPNVFYEVGYARAKNKLCILLTDDPDKLPFDLKYRRHIIYSSIQDF